MTNWKKNLSQLLFFTATLSGFWFLSGEMGPKSDSPVPRNDVDPYLSKNPDKPQIRAPGSLPQSVRNPVAVFSQKTSEPIWKTKLEKVLLIQGAGELKSATIQKVDSFNWKMGNVEIPVDSVIVKLEHVKGHRSSFRAIVDSSSGKLLQTWDQPTFDDFGDKRTTGIKLDPRYHND